MPASARGPRKRSDGRHSRLLRKANTAPCGAWRVCRFLTGTVILLIFPKEPSFSHLQPFANTRHSVTENPCSHFSFTRKHQRRALNVASADMPSRQAT